MNFDVKEVDRLLTTTRSVRRKLDLARQVSNDVLFELIDVAEQAPSGSNQASRRWLIVRDERVKKELAEIYRDAGSALLGAMSRTEAGARTTTQKVFSSAGHLAVHLERVPALVIL